MLKSTKLNQMNSGTGIHRPKIFLYSSNQREVLEVLDDNPGNLVAHDTTGLSDGNTIKHKSNHTI